MKEFHTSMNMESTSIYTGRAKGKVGKNEKLRER
jgi:hypothetical protein